MNRLNPILIIILIYSMALAPVFASVSVTYDQSLSDSIIWPYGSGKSPDATSVSIAVKGSGDPCLIPIRVILAIDSSGSMNSSDPDKKRIEAATWFVRELLHDPKNTVGAVIWDTNATLVPLTNNPDKVSSAIENVDEEGGTDLDIALSSSIDLFPMKENLSGTSDFIVLLSDGMGKYTPTNKPGSLTDLAKNRGIKVFTIALGNQSDIKNLTEIAKVTGGEFHLSANAEAVEGIYKEIISNIKGFLAENVTVTYGLPKILRRVNLTPAPDSITESGDLVILKWNAGPIVSGKSWNAKLNLAAFDPGDFPLGINSVVSYMGCDGAAGSANVSQKTLSVKVDRPFTLAGYGEGGNASSNITKVSLVKEVIPNQNEPCPDCPNIYFKVSAPSVPCNLEILFAIDKSGSMRELDQSGQFNNISMKRDIDNILRSLPAGTKAAIVSWDDDAPLDSNDLVTSSPGFVTLPAGLVTLTNITNNFNLSSCLETDQTIYSSALERINSILSSAPLSSVARSNTVRLVVLVTSWSEFKPERKLGDLRREINSLIGGLPVECRDKIYTFYLGPAPDIPPYREAQLNNLSNISLSTGGSGPQWLNYPNIQKAIDKEVAQCADRPWVGNMVLTDTLYPYLTVIKTNPYTRPIINPDGTTTLIWNIGSLGRGKSWDATVETEFNMTLPVDLTSSRTPVSFSAGAGTPASELVYTWPGFYCNPGTNKTYQMSVPEGKLRLSCGVPCQVQVPSSTNDSSSIVNETSKTPQNSGSNSDSNKDTPGFGFALGLLAMMALARIRRR